MKVKSHCVGQVVVAELIGEIDTVDTDGFADALNQVMDQHPAKLVLEFSQVNYIASMGLSLLLRLAQDMRKAHGTLVITGVRPVVKLVLDTVRLGAVIPIEPTLKKALEKMDSLAAAAS